MLAEKDEVATSNSLLLMCLSIVTFISLNKVGLCTCIEAAVGGLYSQTA